MSIFWDWEPQLKAMAKERAIQGVVDIFDELDFLRAERTRLLVQNNWLYRHFLHHRIQDAMPMSPSEAERIRIIQEVADTLTDDLDITLQQQNYRANIVHAMTEVIERWEIYKRGGELYPPKDKA